MTKKKLNISNIYTTFLLIVCLAISIVLADTMSTIITVGNFSNASQNVKYPSFDIYAIALNKSPSKLQAKTLADDCKKQNAAGFLWLKDGNYYVLSSAYESENDAEKVKIKLLEQNVESEIVKITFPQININGEFSAQEKTALSTALNIFKSSYKSLYDISVSLDTKTITEIEAQISIGNIKSNITKIKTEFDVHFSNKITNDLLNIKLKLAKLYEIVEKLIEGDKTSEIPISSYVKYSYFEILQIFIG